MDMYENGFYTEMLESLRRGAIDSAVMEMSIREELDSFLSKHKKFLKESSKKVVEYRGNQMPLYEAMLLYMTLNREGQRLLSSSMIFIITSLLKIC